uniref:Uncharacterized protein n=1 Tax=Rhizophora mucronata TaxID=61149 RepID=A0A2P2IK11_RHIMU
MHIPHARTYLCAILKQTLEHQIQGGEHPKLETYSSNSSPSHIVQIT